MINMRRYTRVPEGKDSTEEEKPVPAIQLSTSRRCTFGVFGQVKVAVTVENDLGEVKALIIATRMAVITDGTSQAPLHRIKFISHPWLLLNTRTHPSIKE